MRALGESFGATSLERVASHLNDTKNMVKEVTDRITLHEAIEASLRGRLAEVEAERDSYQRKLAESEASLGAARLVEESMMGRLQRTITSYEAKLDDMEGLLETTQAIERTLLAQVAQLRARERENIHQLRRSRAMTITLLAQAYEARNLDPFEGLVLPDRKSG